MATKGRWATMIQSAIVAKVRQESAQRVSRAGRTSSTQQNRATLAKALANIPATQAPRASGPKPVPSSAATNKARLAAILSDD